MPVKKENLFQSEGFRSVRAAILTIVIGMLFGLVVLLLVTTPQNAFGAFRELITGGFLSMGLNNGIGRMLFYAPSYLMCGLAVGLTFKTGSFNIGACGQFIIGDVAAIFICILGYPVFGSFTWVLALIGAGIAGMLWSMIPAVLLVTRGVNLILSGMMLNYTIPLICNWAIKSCPAVYDKTANWTNLIPKGARIPSGFMADLFPGTSANLGIFICIAAALLIYFVFKRTTFGLDMRVCGANIEAARYAGINTGVTSMASLALSGFMAGVAGAMFVMTGSVHYQISDTALGNGWTGFNVALLAMSHPIGMVFTSLFVAFLNTGGLYMQAYGLEPEMVDIITSAIIFLCAFTTVLRGPVHLRLPDLKAAAQRRREKKVRAAAAGEGGER